MWAAVGGSSPAEAQRTLQTLGCLVQGWRDTSSVRCLIFSAGAQEDFVDISFNLFREDGGKHGTHTLQHVFPQDQVATSEVQYENTWSDSRER